jgi:hypothetical protein
MFMPLRYQRGHLRCVNEIPEIFFGKKVWEDCRIRRTAVKGSIDEYPTEELAQAAFNGFRVRLNENRNRQGQQVIPGSVTSRGRVLRKENLRDVLRNVSNV